MTNQDGRATKFIFVTGGVVSSLGKGLAAASIGALLSQALGEIRRPSVAPLPAPGEPIRLGFLSADFYDHPVPRFMLPILRHLDL